MELKNFNQLQANSTKTPEKELELDVEKIIQNELAYFQIPEELKERAKEALEIDDLLFATSDLINDNPIDARGVLIKVYRSKQWLSSVPKDAQFKHRVIYYSDIKGVSREFLPEDLANLLNKKWDELQKKYSLVNMSEKESMELFNKILKKEATAEEEELYQLQRKQKSRIIEEHDNYTKAALLVSDEIEKKVIVLNNPLIIRGYKYDGNSYDRSEDGIKDIRYITEQEIANMKNQGYDGIVFEQCNWVIVFKE